ncbi:DUF4129 domain-containing protein [Isoptericola sediminis]|uniref:DUF4129 domain-containing protein n=1 Tax=Isoptericola sediminis TaxID=2733572 RepID=A0A849JSI9_9MICO|nr:DUF4129 domain-containing protein [Isoptericola sediminis]NNU26272.1 DUF4129 domain-containing protein [Isoptericola sediminis]
MNRPHPGGRPLLLTGLATLVVLGAATATPWQVRMPTALAGLGGLDLPDGPTPSAVPSPVEDLQTTEPDDSLLTVLLLVGAAVAFLLLALVARRVLTMLQAAPPAPQDPDQPAAGAALAGTEAPSVPLPALDDAVTRALGRLDDARTPHDAVVAAWVALEDAAAEHGTPRDPAQTPTEYTQDLLARTPAPPAEVTTLRRLYQQARFADHPTTDAQVGDARAALTRIARRLATAPTADRTP